MNRKDTFIEEVNKLHMNGMDRFKKKKYDSTEKNEPERIIFKILKTIFEFNNIDEKDYSDYLSNIKKDFIYLRKSYKNSFVKINYKKKKFKKLIY